MLFAINKFYIKRYIDNIHINNIMKFACSTCNYSTNDKSNFNKHLRVSHNTVIPNNHKTNILNKQENSFQCEKCQQIFTNRHNLSRHRLHRCNITHENTATENINKLTERVTNLENERDMYKSMNQQLLVQNENMSNLLMDYVKSTNTVNCNNNNNKITYNISVKNYLQQTYPNAPVLGTINDYSKLMYDDYDSDNINSENSNNNYDDNFIDTLVFNYNNSHLNKYLGDFIIQSYKKDNPSTQSIWSSDISRLTYIIKELLSNNESIWNHDYKGVKIKIYVIDPLLKYIKKHIDEYWIKNIDNFKTVNIEQLNKFNKTYSTIYQIKKDIDGDILGNNIVKYITPHFYINKTTQ